MHSPRKNLIKIGANSRCLFSSNTVTEQRTFSVYTSSVLCFSYRLFQQQLRVCDFLAMFFMFIKMLVVLKEQMNRLSKCAGKAKTKLLVP